LLTDQDEIINLYKGPSIDASYQVLVHLAVSEEKIFRNHQSPVAAMFVNGSG
jgi:hypothetical protein